MSGLDSYDRKTPPNEGTVDIARKRAKIMCPAANCDDYGTEDDLAKHWQRLHNRTTLLYLCPFRACGVKKAFAEDLEDHIAQDHQLSSRGLQVINALPSLVQIVPNRRFRHPGPVIPSLAVQPTLPTGSLPFMEKDRISQLLEDALQEAEYSPDSCTLYRPTSRTLLAQSNGPCLSACDSPTSWDNDSRSLPPTPDKTAPTADIQTHLARLALVTFCLEQERSDLRAVLESRTQKDLDECREQNKLLHQRLHSLESENRRLRENGHEPVPTLVSHLEQITSTRAAILFPNCGVTTVYQVEAQDIHLLDLPHRAPARSSDPL